MVLSPSFRIQFESEATALLSAPYSGGDGWAAAYDFLKRHKPNSPIALQIIEVDRNEERWWVRYERVPGLDLLDWVALAPLDKTQTIARQIVIELSTYFRSSNTSGGFLHRPALVQLDSKGATRVLDLESYIPGIAGPLIYQPGSPWSFGWFDGLAPECVLGEEPIEASRVYTLGILLVFLLTGQRLLDSEEPATKLTPGLRALIKRSSPISTLLDVPSIFAALLDKATAPEPTQRFETLMAFEAALSALPLNAEQTADQCFAQVVSEIRPSHFPDRLRICRPDSFHAQ